MKCGVRLDGVTESVAMDAHVPCPTDSAPLQESSLLDSLLASYIVLE